MEKNKFLLIILFIGIKLIIPIPIQADETTEEPVLDHLDWLVDGSSSPIYVNITETFTFITKVLIHIDWTDNFYDIEEFAGESPLSNGINAHFNGIQVLPDNITSNDDIGHYSDEGRLTHRVDDKNPKFNSITSVVTLNRFMTTGIYMEPGDTFGVVVFDDLTTVSNLNETHMIVMGFYDPLYHLNDEITTIEDKEPNPMC